MRLRRKSGAATRREVRSDAFRSRDLVRRLRPALTPWLQQEQFGRLGDRGWSRHQDGQQLMIAIQCRKSGWDRFSGGEFVVELELSRTAKFSTGYHRARIWLLLEDAQRQEALEISDSVARRLPTPDEAFLSALPSSVRDHYLQAFAPTLNTPASSDVWFRYYDEDDADLWAAFLARTLSPALRTFLAEPPSFFGWRPPPEKSR